MFEKKRKTSWYGEQQLVSSLRSVKIEGNVHPPRTREQTRKESEPLSPLPTDPLCGGRWGPQLGIGDRQAPQRNRVGGPFRDLTGGTGPPALSFLLSVVEAEERAESKLLRQAHQH